MWLTLHTHRADGSRRAVQIDERAPLGRGGEGLVYPLRHDPHYVVKMFARPDAVREAKIRAMIAAPPAVNRDGHLHLAWPEAIVTDTNGRFLGYMMPRIDMRRSVPLDWYLLPAQRKAERLRGDSETDLGFRLTIARNIAAILVAIHAAGHALVDLKPPNILVDREHGTVVIVDCDGSRIFEPGRIHPALVATEEYLAPEFHGRVKQADARQDRFALAVIVFRLLNDGLYPTNGTPLDPAAPASHIGRIKTGLFTVNPAAAMKPHPGSIQSFLADETIDLFRRGLSAAGLLRPAPYHWQCHLEQLLKRVRPCRAGRHAMLPKGCPWCGEIPMAPRPAPPVVPPPVVKTVRATPANAIGAAWVRLNKATKAGAATIAKTAVIAAAALAMAASEPGGPLAGYLSKNAATTDDSCRRTPLHTSNQQQATCPPIVPSPAAKEKANA